MRIITKRGSAGAFTVTQSCRAAPLGGKQQRLELCPVVRAVAKRLILAQATLAKEIALSFLQVHFGRLVGAGILFGKPAG